MNVTFNTREPVLINRIGASEEEIINEPMLHSSSLRFARQNGGHLTNLVLNILERELEQEIPRHIYLEEDYYPVIDTKSVLLQKGQWPCIPGWHCDGALRSERGDQPSLKGINDRVVHYICSVSGPALRHAPTELLANKNPSFSIDKDRVWGSLNEAIVKELDYKLNNTIEIKTLKSGDIVKIYRDTVHRCGVAEVAQWRWFFRLSFYHKPPMNIIRKQAMVYANVNNGW